MVHWNVDKKTVVLVGKMGNIFSKEGMMDKQPRCKDCWFCWNAILVHRCGHPKGYPKTVNPGQFACKKIKHKEK